MELTDVLHVALRPAGVAEALCDSTLVRASLDNCEAFTRLPSGEYALTVTIPVGPLRARYDVRAHLANADATCTRTPAERELHRTLNFKASAAGVGALRGQVDIVLREGADDDGAGAQATRIDYAVWATLTGPLAELPARQIEHALHDLAEDFFAEFAAVVEAKHGKRPNRQPPAGQSRRQHVFLRPISLSGLARQPRGHDPAGVASEASGDALVGRRAGDGPGEHGPRAMPLWLWAVTILVVAVLLYLFRRLA